ncbi:MAG: ribosomal RNA small subunit methyltransferase A [Gemmatimonadetes bacterium]|nr:MAG: ribosomal RNA small subunit methyltransferase A [Gemmatimonadota bacterium]
MTVARAPGWRGRKPPVLKKFGQHFLSDNKILSAIVDALAPTASDTVVEVGPGRGSLTDILAERSGKVIAVEIDRALAGLLRDKYRDRPNVEIVEGDFLETDVRSLVGGDYLLIGNVPYYITTPIVFKALETPMPRRSVFLVQREVADRMSAKAGDEEYGALTVNIAVVAKVEQVMTVPATAFRPPPKVESAVVRITPLERPPFRTFVQAAFGQRRKQIQRVLRSVRAISIDQAVAILEQTGIEPTARPEVVSPGEFATLFRLLRETPT